MNFMLDLDDDFEIFDNTEDVELFLPNAVKGVCVQALRRQVSVREAAASGGAYTTSDVHFNIPRSKVCKSPPGVGSLIVTCSEEYYTIYQVDKATLKSRFRCWCHAPVISSDLGQVLTIDEIEIKLDSYDAPYEAYAIRHQNVRGKVYTESLASEIKHEQKQLNPRVMIYLAGITEFKPTWRVRTSGGETYNVSRVMTPDLGRLIALEATLARTPAAM